MVTIANLPLPGTTKLVTASFFRACSRSCKPLGQVKQFAVSIDAVAVQPNPNASVLATDTYHVKVAQANNVEFMLDIWVKAAQASVAIEEVRHFYSRAYGIGFATMPQVIAFAAGMPDAYFLGGPTSIEPQFDPASSKAYKGMRFCRIDGTTDVTVFTMPKTVGTVFPYLGRPENYVTGDIPVSILPLALTSSNVAGSVVKTIIPVRYKGKIAELLAGTSTATPRQASYYDLATPTLATHFAVYDHSDPENVILTIENRA